MAQYVIVSTHLVVSHSHSPEIDPETAKLLFFFSGNVAKWVVLEQWHAYQMAKHQALSRSGATANGSPNRIAKA